MHNLDVWSDAAPPKLLGALLIACSLFLVLLNIQEIETLFPVSLLYILALISAVLGLYFYCIRQKPRQTERQESSMSFQPRPQYLQYSNYDMDESYVPRNRVFSETAQHSANNFVNQLTAREERMREQQLGYQGTRMPVHLQMQKTFMSDQSTLAGTGPVLNNTLGYRTLDDGIYVDNYGRETWGNEPGRGQYYGQFSWQEAAMQRNKLSSNQGGPAGQQYGARPGTNQRADSVMGRQGSTVSGSMMRPRSVSPFQGDPMGSTSRTAAKRSVFLMKDSVRTMSNYGGARAASTQETYTAAIKSLESLGGVEQVFLNSLKQLQRWILTTLFERYYDENRKNLLAINGLLVHFNRTLYEADLLKDRIMGGVAPTVSNLESVSLSYLMQVFSARNYRKEDWLRVLGKCTAKDSAEATKIAQELDREMIERFKLDQWLKHQDVSMRSQVVYCLGRIRDLRGTDPTLPNSGYSAEIGQFGHPSDAELVVTLFVNYVLQHHPGLVKDRDFEAIFREGYIARDGSRLPDGFKIRKWEDRYTNFFCYFGDNKIDCQTGVNNAFAVCLYLLHWIRTEKSDPEHVAALTKTPDGQRLDQLINSLVISPSRR